MMRRLSYRLSNSVVWESQKFSIIRKKKLVYLVTNIFKRIYSDHLYLNYNLSGFLGS